MSTLRRAMLIVFLGATLVNALWLKRDVDRFPYAFKVDQNGDPYVQPPGPEVYYDSSRFDLLAEHGRPFVDGALIREIVITTIAGAAWVLVKERP